MGKSKAAQERDRAAKDRKDRSNAARLRAERRQGKKK